jgi:hypothetical protein
VDRVDVFVDHSQARGRDPEVGRPQLTLNDQRYAAPHIRGPICPEPTAWRPRAFAGLLLCPARCCGVSCFDLMPVAKAIDRIHCLSRAPGGVAWSQC